MPKALLYISLIGLLHLELSHFITLFHRIVTSVSRALLVFLFVWSVILGSGAPLEFFLMGLLR